MIDGYKIKNGKVIVVNYDDEDNMTEEEREYQDNIEELLMEENIKDYLNNLKSDISKNIVDNEGNIKYWNSELGARCIVMFFVTLIGEFFLSLVTPILGLCFALVSIIIGLKISLSCLKKIKELKKEIKGYELELVGIEEEIQKNKIKLRKLRNDDKVEKDDVRAKGYVQLNYVEELKRLRDYLKLWCVVGVNDKEFKRYYEKNLMFSKLDDRFSYEEIKTLRRIISNNNEKKY